jgi:hypothetical protein
MATHNLGNLQPGDKVNFKFDNVQYKAEAIQTPGGDKELEFKGTDLTQGAAGVETDSSTSGTPTLNKIFNRI